MLDVDGDGFVTIDEFKAGILMMKGEAKSRDCVGLQSMVSWLNKRLQNLETKVDRLNVQKDLVIERLDMVWYSFEQDFVRIRQEQEQRAKNKQDVKTRMYYFDQHQSICSLMYLYCL